MPGASGGGDVRAEDRGELDRVHPHTTGPALDQDTFARLEAGLVRQRLPGRERGQGQRGGLSVGYRARPACQVGRRSWHVVGSGSVPVERDEAVHLLPSGQAGRVLAQHANNPGHLVRGNDRRAVPAIPGGPGRVPGQLGKRNARRVHLHQGLARPRHRDRGLLEYQLLWPAAGVRTQCHHRGRDRHGLTPCLHYCGSAQSTPAGDCALPVPTPLTGRSSRVRSVKGG